MGPWKRAGIDLERLDRMPQAMALTVLRGVLRSHVEEIADGAKLFPLPPPTVARFLARGMEAIDGENRMRVRSFRRQCASLARKVGSSNMMLLEQIVDLRTCLTALLEYMP